MCAKGSNWPTYCEGWSNTWSGTRTFMSLYTICAPPTHPVLKGSVPSSMFDGPKKYYVFPQGLSTSQGESLGLSLQSNAQNLQGEGVAKSGRSWNYLQVLGRALYGESHPMPSPSRFPAFARSKKWSQCRLFSVFVCTRKLPSM